jgi:cytochrome b6-f complex iron-sulfur subunit
MSKGHGSRTTSASDQVSRRNFIRSAVIGGGAVVVGVGAFGVGRMLFSNEDKRPKIGVVTIPKAEVPAVGAEPLRHDAGGFYLMNNEDGALAMSWICTHRHCTVPWTGDGGRDAFQCPCHGSAFNRFGERTSGPAPRPLDLLPLTFDSDGNARIDTDSITERDEYDPSQAVRVPG